MANSKARSKRPAARSVARTAAGRLRGHAHDGGRQGHADQLKAAR